MTIVSFHSNGLYIKCYDSDIMGYTIGEALREKGVRGAEFVAANDLLDIFASALIGDNLKVKKFSCVPPVIVRINTESGLELGIVRSVSKKPNGDLRVHVTTGTTVSRIVVGKELLEVPSRFFL